MKFKSIILVVITALVTIVIVQNNEPVNLDFLWTSFEVSKLIVLGSFFIIGLIVGLIIRFSGGKKTTYEESGNDISEEDKTYLS